VTETNHKQASIHGGNSTRSNIFTHRKDTGFRLFENGRYGESLRCYEKALEEDPDSSSSLNGRGINLLYLGRHTEALECYEKALEIKPNSFLSWIGKAISLESLGRHTEALECYEKALEIYRVKLYRFCLSRNPDDI